MSNGTNETGNGSGGDRSCHRGRCALWLRVDGCRLWAERAVPPGAHGSQTDLGGRYPAPPQGLSCRCADEWPIAKRGRPRQRHVPDILSIPAKIFEMPFSNFKAFLRKVSEQTVRSLCRRIGSFVPTLSRAECRNYFRHAGYAPI